MAVGTGMDQPSGPGFAGLLARLLRPHLPLLAVVAVFQVGGALTALLLPRLNAEIIDRGIVPGNVELIATTGIQMGVIAAVQAVCAIASVVAGARIATTVGRELRGDVFGRVSAFSQQDLVRFGTPTLLTRSTNDVQQVESLVLTLCAVLAAAPLLAIGGVVLAIQEDLILSSVFLAAIPILIVPVTIIFRRLRPLWDSLQNFVDGLSRVLREQLTGIRVVRAFGREALETARFDTANSGARERTLQVARLDSRINLFINPVFLVGTVAVLAVGALRVSQGGIGVGSVTAALGYLLIMLGGVTMGTIVAAGVPRALVSGQRIAEVLATEPSIASADAAISRISARPLIEFRDVAFRYPGAERPVLESITFTMPPGSATAIVGSTGSGKTTLVDLIVRLFDVTAGAVLIDGIDVRKLDLEDVWSRIAIVPQRSHLFAGTIASNLRFGSVAATEDEMWAALEVAAARDFVAAMPEGLNAPVLQGGSNLSGGQRQRIAIARAVVKRPAVYIFDDAFSALDTATDARVRAALEHEAGDASVLMVAQRVSAITGADQIVVLDGGRIAGRGTHDELVRTCPEYAEIVASQLAADDVEEDAA